MGGNVLTFVWPLIKYSAHFWVPVFYHLSVGKERYWGVIMKHTIIFSLFFLFNFHSWKRKCAFPFFPTETIEIQEDFSSNKLFQLIFLLGQMHFLESFSGFNIIRSLELLNLCASLTQERHFSCFPFPCLFCFQTLSKTQNAVFLTVHVKKKKKLVVPY